MTMAHDTVPMTTNGKAGAYAPDALVRREVTLVGVTPLLMNRLSEESLLAIRAKAKKPKNAPKPTPREECEDKVHTHDGKPVLPVQNLLACLIEAGKFCRLDGKRQISTAKSTILPAFMHFEEGWFAITAPDSKDAAAWDVDIRAGRNPNGGEVVCLCRPRFDAWSIKATVRIYTDQIAEASIRELFDLSGSRVGVGDFRPQRKGVFGQFRVDGWKLLK
jgi:hypothetical protein